MVNDKKGHGGWHVVVRTPVNVQVVIPRYFSSLPHYIEQSPRKSTRRLSQIVGISRVTMQKIINNDLKLFPYKVQIPQKLTNAKKKNRSNFVWVLVKELSTKVLSTWFCSVMEPIFIWVEMSTNKTCSFGHITNPMNIPNDC